MLILLIVVVLTIGVSFVCSLCEAVLYSTRLATLESIKKHHRFKAKAEQFIEMKRNISVPIAAILILNTIANTAGATIAGMYATRIFGPTWVPVFSISLTLGILFISEVIPKNYGAVEWRKLWPRVIWPLNVIKRVLYPAVVVTERIARLVTKNQSTATVTEDEILALVRLGAHAGEISHDEGRLVKNIIDLEDKQARQIMTPRTVIFSVDGDSSLADVYAAIEGKEFTRVLVYQGDKENFIGYVMLQDLNSRDARTDETTRVNTIVRPITFVPETVNCLSLLLTFLKDQLHICILADEFGGVSGIVSLEDLLETVLGTEIVDETDKHIDLQKVARQADRSNEVEPEKS